MFLKSIVFATSLFVTSAIAAPPRCEPFRSTPEYDSLAEDMNVSTAGWWLMWYCYEKATGKYYVSVVLTRADYSTLLSLGGKLDTARKGLSNFQASWNRNVTLGVNDPALDEVRADFYKYHPEYIGYFK